MAINFAGGSYDLRGANPLSGVVLTISCWFQVPDLTNLHPLVSRTQDSTDSNAFLLAAWGTVAADPIGFSAIASGSSSTAYTTSGYTANNWHHACGVGASSTDRRVYLDGGHKNTSGATRTPGSLNTLAVGSWARASAVYGSAIVAEVGIWDVALSDSEVALLATGLSPMLVRRESLVAYYPLLEHASPSLEKIKGNSLTWNGSPTPAAHPRIIYPAANILQFPSTAAGGGVSVNVNGSTVNWNGLTSYNWNGVA